MCRVLNKRHAGLTPGAVYFGRGSKWGNPFVIGHDGDRATVIVKYERWLAARYDLLRALDELRGKIHADPRAWIAQPVISLSAILAGRVSTMRCTVLRSSASTAQATAR